MTKTLCCGKCGKSVANYVGTIQGILTWFPVCSMCLYGVPSATDEDMKKN